MNAVNVDLAFVQKQCPPGVYKSVWDRLVKLLFGAIPFGMNGEAQIPHIDIWKDGVALLSNEYPYSFSIMTEGTDAPKPGDVIDYNGQFYIVGEVED